MNTEERPVRRRTMKNMAFAADQHEAVQRVADAELEGNFSMAVRRLVAEALTARQTAQAGAGR
jgi:hypothetical protein